jgi:uncharacterized membrane protein YidH (DUF202 family)
MNESQQKFRDRLLSAEKSLPTEKYRKEMADLQERKLSPAQRTIIAIVAAGTLVAAVYIGWLAATPPRNLPMLARLGLGLGAICSFALAAVAAGAVKRGKMRRKIDPNQMVTIIFVAVVVFAPMMLGLMDQVADVAKRVEIGSSALLFFGMGCFLLLITRGEQMELRTREKLLEIELQVQQLAEEIRRSPGSSH